MGNEFRVKGLEEEGSFGQTALGNLDVFADIVYCIDLTSSMKPIIDKVKSTALTLHKNLQEEMRLNYQRSIKQLRIKVIGFRDAYCDGEKSFEVSKFFYLPNEAMEFKHFVDQLEAKGGGDIPENSLEALALAMQSDWCTTVDSTVRKRHIIVLFTDASAHPLEQAKDGIDENYPSNMPENYQELVNWWSGQSQLAKGNAVEMDQIAKRMAIYAPESSEPWAYLADDFDGSILKPIAPDNGGNDITTDELIKVLSETMAG